MTNEEFEKIISLNNKIKNLDAILHGTYGDSESPKIQKLTMTFYSGRKESDVSVYVPHDLSDDIIKLVESRLEKLKEEFENFKTE